MACDGFPWLAMAFFANCPEIKYIFLIPIFLFILILLFFLIFLLILGFSGLPKEPTGFSGFFKEPVGYAGFSKAAPLLRPGDNNRAAP